MLSTALVVDDNFYNRDLARMALDTLEFATEEAVNGSDALEKLKANTFDLLVLDIEMPEVDGIEVLQRLQGDPRHTAMKIIIMTAHRQYSLQISTDVDHTVYKPIDINSFVVMLSKLKFGH